MLREYYLPNKYSAKKANAKLPQCANRGYVFISHHNAVLIMST